MKDAGFVILLGGLSAEAAIFYYYHYFLCPSRRYFSKRDRGVALYCSLLLNRRLEVQADLYHKPPSGKVFISGPVGLDDRVALNKAAWNLNYGIGKV